MNFDKKDFIILILIIVICIMLQYIFSLRLKSDDIKPQPKVKQENNVEFKVDDSISNIKKPETKILPDTFALDNEFYKNLKYCTPIELATNTQLEYSIYGFKDNKCTFQYRMDFYVLDCALPTDILEKYADEGLQIQAELENLKKQNKTGFVKAGDYITDINNNSGYCKSYNKYSKH